MHTPDHGIKENFFRFAGRLNRRRYLLRSLLLFVLTLALCAAIVAVIAAQAFDPTHPEPGEFEITGEMSAALGGLLLLFIPITVSGNMLMIRRLHDLSMSGCYILLQFIPFLTPALMLYLFCKKGTAGENAYGADPCAAALAPDTAPLPASDAAGAFDTAAPAGDAADEMPALGASSMADAAPLRFFTRTGRLDRGGFAMIIGAFIGLWGLITWLEDALLLAPIYLLSAGLFHESTPAFWVLSISVFGLTLLCGLFILPLLSIPAALRRLHDIGRSAFFILPLALSSIGIIVFGVGASLMSNGLIGFARIGRGAASPEEGAVVLGMFVVGSLIVTVIVLFLCIYGGWLFLKKGAPAENAHGAPPAPAAPFSLRAAYLSAAGTIDRDTFILRGLIAVAASLALCKMIDSLIITPLGMIATGLELIPYGVDDYISLLLITLAPLGALPLVLRRLRAIGRSGAEAFFVFAALLPYPIVCVPIARVLGLLQDNAFLHGGDPQVLFDMLTVTPTSGSIAVAAFAFVCGVASVVGIVRLLRR